MLHHYILVAGCQRNKVSPNCTLPAYHSNHRHGQHADPCDTAHTVSPVESASPRKFTQRVRAWHRDATRRVKGPPVAETSHAASFMCG